MKAKLLKRVVYEDTVEIGEQVKCVTRILQPGTCIEIEEIDEFDCCTIWQDGTLIYLQLEDFTFDGLDGERLDLRLWNMERDSAMILLSYLKNDFPDLNLTTMRKLLTYVMNTDFYKLSSDLQALALLHQEFQDVLFKL
jgi:hypothetical protein